MTQLARPHSNIALALTCAWTLALALTGHFDVLLYMAPALLIAVPLLAGRYLGESLVLRLASPRRRRRLPRPASAQTAPRTPRSWRPLGTALVAFSMAERPPPALVPQLT